MPLSVRICQTVVLAIVWPRRESSPSMRRWPQVGFSFAKRRINLRSSTLVGGRPMRRAGG
jgi:hypothetical protein